MSIAGSASPAARRVALIGILLAALGAMSYGMNLPAARVASLQGVGAIDLVLYRAVVLVLLLGVLAKAQGMKLGLPPRDSKAALSLGLAAAGTGFCYLTAVSFLPAPIAAIIFYAYPLLVILLTPLVERKPLQPYRFGVFAVSFAGLALALGPSFDTLDWRGIVFAALAACFCTWLFFSAARQTAAPLVVFFWSQAIIGICAGLAALVLLPLAPIAVLMAAALPVALTIAGFFAGFGLQLLAARRISPDTAGLMFLLEPITTIMVAALVLDEFLGPVQIAGVMLVIAALAADVLIGGRKAAAG